MSNVKCEGCHRTDARVGYAGEGFGSVEPGQGAHAEIYDVLSEEFVRGGEFYEFMKKSDERFEKLLQELRAFREDTNRRFEAVDKRFDKLDSE